MFSIMVVLHSVASRMLLIVGSRTTAQYCTGGTSAFQNREKSFYVCRMRRQEAAKEDDRKCSELLPKGEFLLMGGGEEPLLTSKDGSKGRRRRLTTCTYEGLQSVYQFDASTIASESVFLDFRDDGPDGDASRPRFAIKIPQIKKTTTTDKGAPIAATMSAAPTMDDDLGKFCNPRVALFILPKEEANLVAHKGSSRVRPAWSIAFELFSFNQALSLLRWHRAFKYCPRCGHETRRNAAGTRKQCVSCDQIHYPQLSPVAITLLTNPEGDRCLLVRQPRFVNGMFSAVAGYIEPGETMEEAVRREVAEEIGMDVLTQRYLGLSQLWPLPTSSLMLGSIATVDPDQSICLDGKELEAARWFSLSQVREAVHNAERDPYLRMRNEQNLIFVPPRGAIAHDLIQHFLNNNLVNF